MNRKIPKSFTLNTPRFILKIPSSDDFSRIVSATRVAGFNDGMLWEPPQNEEELKGPLQRAITSWESAKGYSFSIMKRGSTELLGRISIRTTDIKDVWDVGFWTHPDAQGQGLMTESLNAVLEFGFISLLAVRIEACHAVWNQASAKVLKKNGLRFSRHIEKGFKKRGEWVEENLLEISKSEWEGYRNKDVYK